KQTVHKKWNSDIAILSGDAMLVRAYIEIAKADATFRNRILDLFSKTAIEVCEGQQEDMNFENQKDVSVLQYTKMITKKTAVLLACSLKMGAISGNANENDANTLYNCGKHLGIAFQLK
ncbi:MAG: polyprenyl synthetase family protein, partial [Bacteroidota bacterium]